MKPEVGRKRITVAIPFRVGWGFSHIALNPGIYRVEEVAIPFRVGWGFSRVTETGVTEIGETDGRNPFQGGMGFFTWRMLRGRRPTIWRRNPFQGGMGFFTGTEGSPAGGGLWSQSLSGWDGVFHESWYPLIMSAAVSVSQSLSGWDGVFHEDRKGSLEIGRAHV